MKYFASRAVVRIVDDLRDRSGLGNEWNNIDDDIQDEIIDKWRNIIDTEYNESIPLGRNRMWLVEITDAKRDYPLGVFSNIAKAHEAAKLFIKENYTFGTLESAASYVITNVEIDKVLL